MHSDRPLARLRTVETRFLIPATVVLKINSVHFLADQACLPWFHAMVHLGQRLGWPISSHRNTTLMRSEAILREATFHTAAIWPR